jgi:uncharacterized MAPEG superfamily protein
MRSELFYLTLTTIFTGCMWIPYGGYIIFHDSEGKFTLFRGAAWGNRNKMPELPEFSKRAQRAHNNSVENLVIFGSLVLIINVLGISNATTQTAVMVYWWLRVAQWLVYLIGIGYLRSFLWIGGWVCQLILAAQILMHQ